jgi:hypothetical protein
MLEYLPRSHRLLRFGLWLGYDKAKSVWLDKSQIHLARLGYSVSAPLAYCLRFNVTDLSSRNSTATPVNDFRRVSIHNLIVSKLT